MEKNIFITNSYKFFKNNTKGLLGLLFFNLIFSLNFAHAAIINGSVRQVALGEYHTCAVTTSNKLYCWGKNDSGQLGNDSTADSTIPVEILNNVNYVRLGLNHTCALTTSGALYCWGNNEYGQLGDKTFVTKTVPTLVEMKDNPANPSENVISSVSLANNHTCAINVLGNLYCWGKNNFGQLGNGDWNNHNTPTNVKVFDDGGRVLNNVIQVSLGGDHNCAVDYRNKLYCWGGNSSGQIGNGDANNQNPARNVSQLKNLYDVVYVSAGRGFYDGGQYYSHTCAIKKNGDLYCWGKNNYKQVGNGTENDQYNPTKVLENIKQVRLSKIHACAIANDNIEHLWGGMNQGGNRYVIVDLQDSEYEPENEDIVKMSLGADHTCEIDDTGTLYCVGYNAFGQLGDGTTKSKASPVQISSLSGVGDVSLGANHSCAILTTGALYCWGKNDYGQVGNNTLDNQKSPVNIFDGSGDAPSFCENCCNHWNAANLNTTEKTNCTTVIQNSCNNEGIYDCYNGDDNPTTICRPANCCEDSQYSLIGIENTCSSGGLGVCNQPGTVRCGGESENSETVCDAIPATPTYDKCDGLDNDCNGTIDDDFHVGEECTYTIENTPQGVGQNECLGENDSHCVLVSTFTPTYTSSNTPTITNTFTQTYTPTITNTFTETFTPSNTYTFTETYTPSNTFTNTNTYTNTFTNTYTHTYTNTNTSTDTPTFTNTYTSSNTFTNTPTFTNTNTYTNTSTFTDTPTITNTYTNTSTNTFTNTNTPTFTYTSTYTSTFTNTLTYTNTNTFTNTYTNTNTYTPTHTPTNTPFPDIIDARVELPAPSYKWGNSPHIVTISMQKIVEARLNRYKENTKAKYKYLVRVKKVKRLGVGDEYFKLGKPVSKITHRRKIRFKKLEKGIYSARYRVIIIKGKKTRMTKWSPSTIFRN